MGGYEVKGLRQAVRALQKAGADASDLTELMYAIGEMVVRATQPPIGPTRRLAGSVRAGRSKNKAVVRAGGARVPYAGPIHFGWPARNIKPQPFLTKTAEEKQPEAVRMIDQGMGDLLRKNGLK